MKDEAVSFLCANKALVRNEVLAEVVHVLHKVYKTDKLDIVNSIFKLVKNKVIETENEKVVRLALATFANRSLDFVDCLLYAYNAVEGIKVFTFDKALNKLIAEVNI